MRHDWQRLRFGVEIEFVEGAPEQVALLPGWVMALDELQHDDLGNLSGSELKPGPITWADRDQIRVMLERLKATGARANWSCGLHVHVDLSPWGEAILLPLMDAALAWQDGFYQLLQTAPHRRLYCPPVTIPMREALERAPSRDAVRYRSNPEGNRCGVNLGSWWDIGTVEFRFANGSTDFEEICRTVELCLRFVTEVGAGMSLGGTDGEPVGTELGSGLESGLESGLGSPIDSGRGLALAIAVGAPQTGYPAPHPCPVWRWEQLHLDALLRPVLAPLVAEQYPTGQLHTITPTVEGFLVTVELEGEANATLLLSAPPTGYHLIR
jgi:hypothetical protein